MKIPRSFAFVACLALAASISNGKYCISADKDDPGIVLADGKIHLKVPKGWVRKEPKFKGIVQHEFAVPALDGDKQNGRVTIGGAGGGLDANVSRWTRQYELPDGVKPEIKEEKIGGQDVHVIDVAGTYKGSAFTKEPRAENYRLLAAIIVTEKSKRLGSYYIKFYGPRKTVAKNEKAFQTMLDSLTIKDK